MSSVKKIVIGCLAVALVAVMAIGGSLAFLTDSDEVTNVFAVGDLDIKLTEPNWVPANGTDMRPGKTMMKDPVVEAVDNDSYMRVYMEIVETVKNPNFVDAATTPEEPETIDQLITDTERLGYIYQTIYYDSTFNAGNPPDVPGSGAINNTAMYSLTQLGAIGSVNNGVNTDAFTEDGAHSSTGRKCYIYTADDGIFDEGETATLFTNIVIPTDWNQEQMDKLGNYKIVVKAQAIQTTGFADADAAFAALDTEVANETLQKG